MPATSVADIQSLPKDHRFTDSAVTEINQMGEQIIEFYPSDKYFYIGIGRSPTAIMAWLKAKIPNVKSVQIPLTNFKLCKELPDDKIDVAKFPDEVSKQRLYRYFDTYIQDKSSYDRKWLVIDLAETGNTLRSAGFALNEYSKTRKHNNSVQMLAMTEWDEEYIEGYLQMGFNVVTFDQSDCNSFSVTDLEYFLMFGPAKEYAPFKELEWKQIMSESEPPRLERTDSNYKKLCEIISRWSHPVRLPASWKITKTTRSDPFSM